MPVIVKLPSGNWRAQARRKGKYISNTFRRRADADTPRTTSPQLEISSISSASLLNGLEYVSKAD